MTLSCPTKLYLLHSSLDDDEQVCPEAPLAAAVPLLLALFFQERVHLHVTSSNQRILEIVSFFCEEMLKRP